MIPSANLSNIPGFSGDVSNVNSENKKEPESCQYLTSNMKLDIDEKKTENRELVQPEPGVIPMKNMRGEIGGGATYGSYGPEMPMMPPPVFAMGDEDAPEVLMPSRLSDKGVDDARRPTARFESGAEKSDTVLLKYAGLQDGPGKMQTTAMGNQADEKTIAVQNMRIL